jgi:pimeloyl-ACP methyl ester carboxylesterase
MAAHAAHCHQLMGELGITRAHIVGHSSSVPVALQLALDAPASSMASSAGYRPALDRGMPGAFEQAVADADAFLHSRDARPPAMAIHPTRRSPHPPAGAHRPGNSQPTDVRGTAKVAAAVAAQG